MITLSNSKNSVLGSIDLGSGSIDQLNQKITGTFLNLGGLSREISSKVRSAGDEVSFLENSSNSLSRTLNSVLGRSFVDLFQKGEKLSDVVSNIGSSLSNKVLNQSLNSVGNAITSSFLEAPLFSDVLGKGIFSQATSLLKDVNFFAKGGIVSGPQLFSYGGSQVGVMGESGAEAVLPLVRGPDGRLGVSSGSGNQGQSSRAVNINIQTNDVESFRRSRSQVASIFSGVLNRSSRVM